MAQTTSDAFSSAITFKVQSQVLKNLRARLVFADPAYAEKGTFGPGFDTLMFVSYPDLSTATTPLTEGTKPTAVALTQNVVTVSAAQYGNLVDVSDVAKVKAPVDVADIAAERITRNAAESIDQVSRDSIALGGTAYYQGSNTARADIGSTEVLTAADLMKLRAKMIAAKIPTAADGMFKLFIHPFVGYDLRSESVSNAGAWIDVNRYSRPDQIMHGEIGSYHGFHVIEVNNAPTFSSTTTVYASFALGDIKGWGAGELQTLSVKHVAPGGDHSDPLAQSELFGWKVSFGVAALNNGYYFRAESAATNLA